MSDREKVVRAVETCFDSWIDRHRNMGIDLQVVEQMKRDALELLKEQEPRVMDADEIVLSTDPSKWLWVERKGDYCAEAFKAGKTISGLISFDSETPGAFLYCERPGEYGKTWRCWTSRPTNEQREAVKWDD